MPSKTVIAHTFVSFGMLFANRIKTKAKKLLLNTVAPKTLIQEITLQTAVPLTEMVDFYVHSLGLERVNHTEKHCSFQVGQSILTFVYHPSKTDQTPFYHFAFNIPENQIQEAEAWQLQRTSLIEPPVWLKDVEYYSNNIAYFNHWNAHALFFYDPAGNVVEYIARHDMDNASQTPFDQNQLLNISEIALVVDQVEPVGKQLVEETGWHPYKRNSKDFMVVGSAEGLLLCFPNNTKADFGRGRDRGIFPIDVILQSSSPKNSFQLGHYPYTFHTK